MNEKDFFQLLDQIKYPLITEKTMKLLELNQYTFIVNKNMNKKNIKEIIEFIFAVDVEKVNVLRRPIKIKRVRTVFGAKPNYKKAIVHLSKKDKIDFFDDDILQKKD